MVDSISSSAMRGMDRSQFQPKALTDEQKSTIQSILEKYDSESMTADQAKEIFQAFKDAGIRPGPGMKEAIEEAGFNAEEMRNMAGIEGPGGKGQPPERPQGNQQIDFSALKNLQSILSNYDLTNLTSDQENEIKSKLDEAGLLSSGKMLNIFA